MIWEDECYLLSKKKFRENANIINVFTQKKGKLDGIVYGGASRKIKNYLQVSNKLFVSYSSKSENKLGYFKLEIQKVYSPIYFENSQKLSCINSAMSLIRLLTAESQSNIKIFNLIEKFYLILSNNEWLKDYIFWELELLKTIGFDLELSNFATKELLDDKIIYVVKSKNEKKIIPNFLIDKKIVVNDLNILLNGLKLVSDFLEKTILKPNNLNYPISRTQFINSLR